MSSVTATFVFTDLVGSTALLSRVGEKRADALRREHFALLRDSIAEHRGREVKNLGDGLMVVFDGVTSALEGAVAMQQALAARPTDAEPLAIRVGVATGEAEFEDGDYFGLPVVEAARLCAKADGGEILVTEFVRMLARSRSTVELESIGALELKGVDEPVETYRVVWAPLVPSEARAVPLPTRVERLMTAGFVGRVREREVLDVAFKAVEQGERRAVLISGEPGIGKTAITARFASDAAEQGACVLFGRCDEDLFVPYQPWIEALEHLAAHMDEAVLAEHVEHRGRVLARLVPSVAARTAMPSSAAEDEGELHLLFGAVVDILDRASGVVPVVLVLEDLHWADAPTAQLLRHVIANGAENRLMVVGTFRDSEVGREHVLTDVLAALHREVGVERMALQGLGDDELLALLERNAGHEMNDDGVALRDALLLETAGNPFFVGEMLRHLAETGAIYQNTTGRWVSDTDVRTAGLPVSIREVVGRRVARLGTETTAALSMAAVIGRDFDLALLEEIVDLGGMMLVDLCDRAVDAAVLRETDIPERYTFAHALIEHTLYEGLSVARRARAHRAVAEALEAQCGDETDDRVGELAYHWAKATRPQDAGKAVEYARRAGDRAIAKLAPAEALRWYSDALALLEDGERNERTGLEVRIGLGEARKFIGDGAYHGTLVRAADDALKGGYRDLGVRAAFACSRGYWSAAGVMDEEYVAVIRAALDAVGPDDSPERARLASLLAGELTWRLDGQDEETIALADDAVAIARRLGNDALLVDVVSRTHQARSTPQTTNVRWRDETDALAAATRTGEPALLLDAHWARAFTAVDRMDRDALDYHCDALERLTGQLSSPYYTSRAGTHAAVRTWLDGDPEAAGPAARRFLHLLAESGGADAVVIAGPALAHAEWIAGNLGALIPAIAHDRDRNPNMRTYDAYLAWAYAWERDLETTEQLVTSAFEREFTVPLNAFWLVIQALWAYAAFVVDHAPSAALLCPRLEPWTDLIASVQTSPSLAVAHYAGLTRAALGDLDVAVGHLELATENHLALRAPFLVACSEVALAEVLVRRGTDEDGERAKSLAVANLSVAEERGYLYIQRDAQKVLDRLG